MTDYAKEVFELLARDRADLRKVTISFINEDDITFYFKPFTAVQHRDCIARAKKTKQIKDISNDTVIEEQYICEYTYVASIIYYQALDNNGNRIFTSLVEIDKIKDKMPYTKLSYLASIMGADVEQEIKEVLDGKR